MAMVPYKVIVIENLNFPKLQITSDLITMKIPAKIKDRAPIIKFFYNTAREIGPVEKQLSGSINARSDKLIMHTRNKAVSICFTSNLVIPEIHQHI